MDETNYFNLLESLDQDIPQTYKYDSTLKPKRIIRLYQTSHDPNISKNKEDGWQEDKPM